MLRTCRDGPEVCFELEEVGGCGSGRAVRARERTNELECVCEGVCGFEIGGQEREPVPVLKLRSWSKPPLWSRLMAGAQGMGTALEAAPAPEAAAPAPEAAAPAEEAAPTGPRETSPVDKRPLRRRSSLAGEDPVWATAVMSNVLLRKLGVAELKYVGRQALERMRRLSPSCECVPASRHAAARPPTRARLDSRGRRSRARCSS